MMAFDLNARVVEAYASFTKSFSEIRALDLKDGIACEHEGRRFWPEALLSLNPAYETGPPAGQPPVWSILAPETSAIFRAEDQPLVLHRHQEQAIACAARRESFVVTTGTGSGKSLCFFVPIIDAAIRARATGEPQRIRAIIVYPMNALANSQLEEIETFLGQSGLPPALRPTVTRYTGQESDTEREAIAQTPPDILLTNLMMLELLLTKQGERERRVIDNCRASRSSSSTSSTPIGAARERMWPYWCGACATAAQARAGPCASAPRPPW